MPTAITGIRGLQETGSGLLTAYQQDSLQGIGLPSLVGLIDVDRKAQATGLAQTTLYTTVQSGVFEVHTGINVYGAGTANGTIQPQVIFTSDDSSTAKTINATSAVSSSSQPSVQTGIVVIKASTGTVINGSTVYAAAGTPSYTLQMVCYRVS